MNKKTTLFLLIVEVSLLLLYSGQIKSQSLGYKQIIGQYNCCNPIESLNLFDDSSFHLLTTGPDSRIFDAVIPFCDTIAIGKWQFINENLLKLINSINFATIPFTISQENKYSQDSIYIKINIPKDDAFFHGRFNYQIRFGFGGSSSTYADSIIAIPRKHIISTKDNTLSLIIQDLLPNCWSDKKCYQRIYFKILDNWKLNTESYNSFRITIDQFTQCYVEKMDVNNELLYLINDIIYWRGNRYIKSY
jgi:hypothetical protein